MCFFFMDGCILEAISGSTYVTFVDVINMKLKAKGREKSHLIRVDCCL